MNNKRVVTFLVLIFQYTYLFGQDKDSLFVEGQAPIIGKLVKIKYGIVSFDGDNLGVVNVDLDKVTTIVASQYVYRVKTTTRDFIFGQFKAHGDDGKIYLSPSEGEEELGFEVMELHDVKIIYGNFFEKLSGEIDAGYSYTKNSGVGRWNGDLVVNYEAKKYDLNLDGDVILTQSQFLIEENLVERERENLQLSMDYYLGPSVFAYGRVNYQRNLELGILRRFQQGVGLGRLIFQSSTSSGRVQTGLTLNQEYSTTGIRRSNLFEVPLAVKIDFWRLSQPEITITAEQAFFAGLSQTGRFRNDGDTKIKWGIMDDFHLKLSFYNNFDTVHPLDGGLRFDYGVVFGLGVSF